MDQEETKTRVMISQNVDSSYEFFNGIGVKQIKYLFYSPQPYACIHD